MFADNRTKSSCLYLCEKYKLNTVEPGYVEVNGPHFCIRNNQKQAINQRTDNTMTKRKIMQTAIYKTLHRKPNIEQHEPTKHLGWTLVIWKGKQFLLHSWHVSCYCCKSGDKSWMRNGPECEYDKHHQDSTIHTSSHQPLASKETFFTRQQKYVTCQSIITTITI